MPSNLLAELRSRRSQIQEETRVRLDELDRLIALVADSDLPNPKPTRSDGGRRRRRGKVTVSEIIDRPVLNGLLATGTVTTKQMADLLPGKRIGPMVSAWKRRAEAAGVVFDDLIEKSMTSSGDTAFSLTEEGRRVFDGALRASPASASDATQQFLNATTVG